MGYKALRHTYGFGVHSPFAFRMVKDVVRPGRIYSWYGYEDIDAVVNSGKVGARLERQAKMFHRLLCFLGPSSLFLPHGVDPIFPTAALAGSLRLKLERRPKKASECEMIASAGDFIPLNVLMEHLKSQGHSVAIMNYPDGWADTLFHHLPQGLMLYGRHNVIIMNRKDMMKVAYRIIL